MKQHRFAETEVETAHGRQQAARTLGRFLKGPIPMTDLWRAARLPGKALALYIAVRHQVDVSGQLSVTVPSHLLRQFDIDKDAKSRAIRRLVTAGLISVDQMRGKAARIKLGTSN